MSYAALQTLYAEYAAARRAGDYDTAIGKLVDLGALRAVTPDTTSGVGAGGNSARWRDLDVDGLIAQLRRLKSEGIAAASGPFQRTNVTYERVTD